HSRRRTRTGRGAEQGSAVSAGPEHNRSRASMKKTFVGLMAILAIAARAQAAPLVISNIVGGWQNANPSANANIDNNSNQQTDYVWWGGSAFQGSGYSFNPDNNPVDYVLGSPFVLGVFTHYNNPIPNGSSITSIDYAFSFSTNGSPSTLSDTF